MPPAGSLLPLEDVLSSHRELLFPLDYLLNGRLGREGETGIRSSVSKTSNTNTNQLLTTCEAATSASLLFINWVPRS